MTVVTRSEGEGVTPAAAAAGRLQDPASSPRTDPRTNPRLVAALASLGLDELNPDPVVTRQSPANLRAQFVADSHHGFEGVYAALANELPGDEAIGVDEDTVVVDAPDGHQVQLHVFRPRGAHQPVPGLVYVHGGGMVILDTLNTVHRRWCFDLAHSGLVVIAIDFRNAYTPKGANPFPVGLGDCAAAVRWIDCHRAELGISRLALQGESGGGNLVLATAIKANREGWLDAIDGVYASVPYISGGYGWSRERKLAELPSLVENDGYFVNAHAMDLLVDAYDPDGSHATDPLCWPYFASIADLRGLPRHVISVNELDPLRDEGIAYFRALLRAGVLAVGHVNLGLVHAADSIFRGAIPEAYRSTVADIKSFAYGL